MTDIETTDSWRDAVRAAELADRLVTEATSAMEQTRARPPTTDQLATMAETAADAADRAAVKARGVARALRDGAAHDDRQDAHPDGTGDAV